MLGSIHTDRLENIPSSARVPYGETDRVSHPAHQGQFYDSAGAFWYICVIFCQPTTIL